MLQEGDYVVGELEVYDSLTGELLLRDQFISKLGTGVYNKNLEKDLIGKEEKEEIVLEYSAENNPFGQRNPNLIRLVPLREFHKRGIKPIPGLVVIINGLPGRILSVSGGRVLVDFNSPIVGRAIKVVIKNLKKVDRDEFLRELAKYLKLEKEIEEKDGKVEVTGKVLKAIVEAYKL